MHATIEDLAKSKGMGKTYVSEVLRLTLLAPGIVGGSRWSCSSMICWWGFRWNGRSSGGSDRAFGAQMLTAGTKGMMVRRQSSGPPEQEETEHSAEEASAASRR